MKTLLNSSLIIAGILLALINHSQVCTPNGISTDPNNPINLDTPSPLFLNHFNWFNNNGLFLTPYPLNDMFSYSPNQLLMNHPFSSDNSGYENLTNVNLDKLDMYYADGWELISVNLGAYPDGTVLTEMQPIQQSAYGQIPYIILYNKKRALLRLFANSLTGIVSGFDHVVVHLKFANQQKLSGLLMPNSDYSTALDQGTVTTGIATVIKHPNNSTAWFYADFQVGYDPCTCLFESDIKIEFEFVNTLILNMVSNEVSTEIALIDEQGNSNINEDFLASVQYNAGFEGAGLLVYNNLEGLVDDYIAKLEAVQAYNESVDQNANIVKRKTTILKIFKFVIIGGASAITGNLVPLVQESANDLIKSIGIQGQNIVIKKDDTIKEVKKILGKEFDSFSQEWIDEPQVKQPSPTVPTARFAESTFNGEINDNTIVGGPTLFNPGTYPDAQNNQAVTAHNYPVYNEILGLFALLESPVFSKYTHWNHDVTNSWYSGSFENSEEGYFPAELDQDVASEKIVRFKLNSPLKLAYNPASGVNASQCTVQASLVMDFTSSGVSDYVQWVPLDPGSLHYSANTINRTLGINNLIETESGDASFQLNNTSQAWQFESGFLDLGNFNDCVFEFKINSSGHYFYETSDGSSNSQSQMESDILLRIQNAPLHQMPYQLYLKLIVSMPFGGPNPTVTTQVFTYKINPSQIIDTPTEIPIPWSYTENPNGNGSDGLAHTLYFEDKNWNLSDYAQYGGIYGDIARPYALTNILINGDQTKSQLNEVVMTAGEEIIVTGESVIADGFTLRIDDIVQMTSSPTPPVTNEFLTSFCGGQQPNQYHANQSRFAQITSTADVSPSYQKMLKTGNALSIYPNPVSESIGIFVPQCSGLALVSIHNAMGELVDSFSNMTDASGLNCYRNLSLLSNGTYTITIQSDGIWFTEKFVVVK